MTTRTALSHRWPARTHVAIFVRCLHLLDLDLLEDWPGISEQLFTAKNAQHNLAQRIRAVEWSLYRLFELYDPRESNDKLRPFFPPTTQLQSLNLRAALYRSLSELKKGGVLGKDAILRKTMFDDCKGERLEEALGNFAMVTLAKVKHCPIDSTTRHVPDPQLLPIVLAHRVLLQHHLEVRKEQNTSTGRELERLNTLEGDLRNRLEVSTKNPLQNNIGRQESLRKLVNSNWIGDHVWIDMLHYGVTAQSVLRAEDHIGTNNAMLNSQALLNDLDSRIESQQDRLSKWKVVAEDLVANRNREMAAVTVDLIPATQKVHISSHFQRHKALNLSNRTDSPTHTLLMDESYQRLLVAMKTELDSLSPSLSGTDSQRQATTLPPVMIPHDSGDCQQTPILPLFAEPETNSSTASGKDGMMDHARTPSPIRSSIGDYPYLLVQEQENSAAPDQGVLVQEFSPLTTVAPSSSSPEPPTSPSKLWMSLADRTKASMSITGRQSILTDPDSPTTSATAIRSNDVTANNVSSFLHSSDDEDHQRTMSLADRTRQSMSLLSSSTSTSAGRRRKVRQKAKWPLPTVDKSSYLPPPELEALNAASTESGRASTPQDQLFTDDADYASVFKSRPKLATSPVMMPQPDA